MSSECSSGKGILLKADTVAETSCGEVKQTLALRARPPKLVGILATASAPSKSYAEFTRKQCMQLGVNFELRTAGGTEEAAGQETVEEAILEANDDDSVDGIMVRVCGVLLRRDF
jgi:methylenetetrahydrofolate dehydrogenase (NAD+)